MAVNKVDKTMPRAIDSLFNFINIKKTTRFKTQPKAITFPNMCSDFIISISENRLNEVSKNKYNDAPITVQIKPIMTPKIINFLFMSTT